MVAPELLAKIRQIRTSPNLKLKPSPYLRDRYVDEYGDERPVTLRNYQGQGVLNMLQMERMLLGDDTGLGKAQPIDSLVLTPTGWVQIGDIRVGDEIIGSNGKTTRVLGVFRQGRKQAYRVTMSDGSSTECCEDHLWTVRTGNSKRYGDGWHVRDLKQIAAVGLSRQRKSTGLRWEIPIVAPIQFPKANLPIDPYLFGVLLGDGCIVAHASITNGDPELFEIARKHFPPDCVYGRTSDDGLTRNIIGTVPGYNSLVRALTDMQMLGTNWKTKSILEVYQFASVEQRVELLRGLMDTDGGVSKDGKVTQFYSSNGVLVRDFIRLVQSLGGVAKVASKVPVLRGKSKARSGRTAFTVTLSLPNWLMPFKLTRKIKRWVPRTKYFPSRRIASITSSRITECVCIRVDALDSLYVTDDFIVTHNTLEVLSTIGYVWMKEPEYVPIIITTKSALFQWEGETNRFMQGMQAVTVHGSPFQRHEIYESFFSQHDPEQKRLLIMSYDMIMYDMHEAVIKEKKKSPRKGFAKEVELAKQAKQEAVTLFDGEKEKFEQHFRESPWTVHQYIADFVKNDEKPPVPPGFSDTDAERLIAYCEARKAVSETDQKVRDLRNEAAPPKKVPGIIDYVQNMRKAHPHVKFILVMDEMHKLKNHKSQFHEKTALLAKEAQRVYGLTATPVKNRLMEFWSLFRIIQPSLFPKISHFQQEFCVTRLQAIGGGRNVMLVVGYKHLDKFVELIEPFYLSRKKHDVAKELPELISLEIECEMTELQEELYDLAETGLLNKNDDPDASNSDLLSAMVMCQQACNSVELLEDENGNKYVGPSAKIDALVELLQTEAEDEKVIVFSKYEKMISLVEIALEKAKIVCTRITGKENNAQVRDRHRAVFQDMNSGVNVMLITTAGSESLNLHSAEHFALMDLPWSWGDYLQLIGRAVRIGSLHKTVVAHHFLARKRDDGKTIDHQVLKALRTKKKLADKVAGENLKGGLKFVEADAMRDVLTALVSERNKTVAKPAKSAKKAKPIAPKDEVPIAVPCLDFSDL
jgi:superfamily II DNA or RNA helicase